MKLKVQESRSTKPFRRSRLAGELSHTLRFIIIVISHSLHSSRRRRRLRKSSFLHLTFLCSIQRLVLSALLLQSKENERRRRSEPTIKRMNRRWLFFNVVVVFVVSRVDSTSKVLPGSCTAAASNRRQKCTLDTYKLLLKRAHPHQPVVVEWRKLIPQYKYCWRRSSWKREKKFDTRGKKVKSRCASLDISNRRSTQSRPCLVLCSPYSKHRRTWRRWEKMLVCLARFNVELIKLEIFVELCNQRVSKAY